MTNAGSGGVSSGSTEGMAETLTLYAGAVAFGFEPRLGRYLAGFVLGASVLLAIELLPARDPLVLVGVGAIVVAFGLAGVIL